MELTFDELVGSKIYVKENSGMNFLSPKDYIQPFVDIFHKKGFSEANARVLVAEPVVNENEAGTKNIAFPKVNLEFHTPSELEALGFKSTIGLVYNLNVGIPAMRVYTGANVAACMNLTIFNAENVFSQNLTSNYYEVYDRAGKFLEDKAKEIEEFTATYNKLRLTQLSSAELDRTIGRLLNNAHKTKLGTTPIVQASKLLFDGSSKYYVGRGEDYCCTLWNVYNAVTQSLSNSTDIVEKSVKTVLLSDLILN